MGDLIAEQNREYEEALREDQAREAREREAREREAREEEMRKAREREAREAEEEEEEVVLSPNALRRVRMEYFARTEKRRRRGRRGRSNGIDVSNILPTRLRSGSFHGRR